MAPWRLPAARQTSQRGSTRPLRASAGPASPPASVAWRARARRRSSVSRPTSTRRRSSSGANWRQRSSARSQSCRRRGAWSSSSGISRDSPTRRSPRPSTFRSTRCARVCTERGWTSRRSWNASCHELSRRTPALLGARRRRADRARARRARRPPGELCRMPARVGALPCDGRSSPRRRAPTRAGGIRGPRPRGNQPRAQASSRPARALSPLAAEAPDGGRGARPRRRDGRHPLQGDARASAGRARRAAHRGATTGSAARGGSPSAARGAAGDRRRGGAGAARGPRAVGVWAGGGRPCGPPRRDPRGASDHRVAGHRPAPRPETGPRASGTSPALPCLTEQTPNPAGQEERPMRTRPIALMLLVALTATDALAATPRTVTRADQREMMVTIYNGNLGLVKDVREAHFPAGTTEVQFADVAALIDPTTVHLKSLTDPAGLKILEQNYEYDLLTSQKLMEKYVGRKVRLHQADGTYHEATLLSTNGPIFEINGQIHMGHYGRLVLPSLPENLVAKPTLVWLLRNQTARPQRVEASYLTGGSTWKADYVMVLNAAHTFSDLTGWGTIDNKSGATHKDAGVKLAAGDGNPARGPRPGARLIGLSPEAQHGAAGARD